MGSSTDVYIFGDQTVPVLENLQSLHLIQDNAILKAFLNEAFFAIRHEISALRATERDAFPRAESLGLLLEAIQKGSTHAALDSACLCIYEIGHYIEFLARNHDREHPPAGASFFLGFCTGSLAAAAISCSSNIFDIAGLGIQAVIVAFRIGMHVYRKAAILGHSKPGCWSIVIPAIQEEAVAEALAEYCTDKCLPLPSQPYISAVSPNFVTVSGPPNVLDALSSLPAFSCKKIFPVPVHGPYHTPSAYSESDLDQLLHSTLDGVEFLDRVAHTPIMSCASGSVVNEASYGGLLREMITTVLVRQIRIDRVIDSLSESLLVPDSVATLIPVNTQIASNLAASLTRRGTNVQIDKVLEDMAAKRLVHTTSPHTGFESAEIAIVGFSGRFPEADGVAEFWDLLRKGLDVHKPIPADRFDREAHYDPKGQRKNTSQVQYGCWLKAAGLFDTQFFHMSPREACQTDPAQRLALLTAYEALEMAGFVPDRTASSQRSRVGVFYGTTSNDWGEVNSSQDIDTYYIPGANRAFIPGRINFFFKFTGPSIAVDTACSSSLAAIDIACSSLLKRDCDTAIAGGTNVLTNPDNFAGLDRGHFLSRTGNCKTFDNAADGYCRADGVGTVILKRLSDAIADNDPVFGVILGAHTNHSAEAVSITRPLADAQEFLFRKLLSETGLKPHDVSYIEMHGTGTQAGDAVEMRSVLNTFAWDYSRQSDKSLYLGSVKANVGHGESASGVTALIKVLLMMQKNKVPPHCGIKGKINEGFPTDLDRRGVRIALGAEADWPRPSDGKRRAFVNNFSAAGGNTALLLEDGPVSRSHNALDPRTNHVVTVSARSAKSLKENLLALADFIGNSTSPEWLAQISYTTTARRIHHSRRVAVVASDLQHLKRSLLEAAAAGDINPVPAKAPGVGFLFTGQGAQETAMAHGLYQDFSSFRSDVREFDAMARLQGLPSILPLVDGRVPVDQLSPTVIQLGTCIIQIALARLWINLGVKPQYVVGHSLGEYAALHIAGVLNISDTIYLCGHRAALLETRCTPGTHGMVAVKGPEQDLRRQVIAGTAVEIACINGPEDIVLSGPNTDIDAVCEQLNGLGYKFTKLVLPFAFHSSQVEPVLDELEEMARRVDFQPPALPFVSTLLSTVVTSGGVIGPQYIRRHCRETVDFLGAVQTAEQENIMRPADICIEIGAHPLLTRMVKSILGSDLRCFPSLRRGEDCFKTLPESLSALHLAGLTLNWDEYHRDFVSSHKVIDLPSYSWNLANYWMQYEYSWCLTKGDPPVDVPPAITAQVKPVRLSDSVHEIVEQTIGDQQSSIVIQSDMHDPGLLPVAEHHRVNGLTLCPSSLYADIAYTLSKYLLERRYQGTKDYMPDICNMAAEKALIVNNVGPQLIRATMTVNWKSLSGAMEVYSVDGSGRRTTVHAKCNVQLQTPQVYEEHWQRHLYLINRSIDQLAQGVEAGSTHRMHRGMAYKLFSSAVQYGPAFQGLQEVLFDSEALEATARVCVPSGNGQYALNPFCCDSLGHITGFVMNSNDSLDLTDHLYVNHGWSHMRFSEPFLTNVSYQTYVKMQAVGKDDSTYSGDVHVLRDGKIVAICEAVTFRKVPRRVLEMLLPSSSNKSKNNITRPFSSKPMVMTPSTPATSVSSASSVSAFDEKEENPAPVGSYILQQALQVISEEIGVDQSQLTDAAQFDDFGVDSLMSLTILGIFREDLDLDLPASLFNDCPSVKSLKDFLSALNSDAGKETPVTVGSGTENLQLVSSPSPSQHPPATSMILQGTKHCPNTLFLFPDGAGSATSYVTLPPISPDLRVYGLNSPYLKNPQDFQCALQDITAPYIAEIRRRQPKGPYHLAGWSAGGVSAYDAALQLVSQGEVVESLTLIDSPNPLGLGKLPPRMYTFLENSGVFGAFESGGSGGAAPAWLYQHFLVFIEALDRYKPVPFRSCLGGGGGAVPKTTIIWAKDGVCKDPSDARPEPQADDPRGMTWLLDNRTDFGPNGWDEFLGPENITICAIDDANHFTMMREPVASVVVDLLRKAMVK